jgi:hypothetical protein
MTLRPSLAMIPVFALLVSVSLAPRAEALPEAINVVAKSLAEHYGVPGDSVTALLDKGMSMESVTELLLVKESSGEPFDEVTDLYSAQGNDIQKTAGELDVSADAYSAENVQAAIDKAKADTASSASDKAAEETGKAVNSLMGGLPTD